jgi:small-conductance mechanosensitive channel
VTLHGYAPVGMAGAPLPRRPAVIDRALAWILALLLGLMGVPMVVALIVGSFQPQPEGTSSGFTGLLLLEGLAFTYGALATLRQEYGVPRAWNPSWTQGFVLIWYWGWSLLLVLALARDLVRGGPELAEKWLGGALAFWFVLVGLPWILATLHARRRRGAAGWVGRN